jgi:hypothetical protein
LNDVVLTPLIPDPRLDPDDVFSISDFYGFYFDKSKRNKCIYDLFYNYHKFVGCHPTGTIPIAESGDNRFCLSCTGDTFDHVYAWLPPEFDDDDPAGELYLMAPSFLGFLRSLRIREE